MLKSCKYCGKIHDSKHDCGKKPVRIKRRTTQNRFRSTDAWKRKSIAIRTRDKFLCQVCIRKMYGTKKQYNNQGLEVHHVMPLSEDYDRRLDNRNLITLCGVHHELAEQGGIPKEVLLQIAGEQEGIFNPPLPQGRGLG